MEISMPLKKEISTISDWYEQRPFLIKYIKTNFVFNKYIHFRTLIDNINTMADDVQRERIKVKVDPNKKNIKSFEESEKKFKDGVTQFVNFLLMEKIRG